MGDPAVPPVGTTRRSWILASCLPAAIVLLGCVPLLLGRAAPVWDAGSYFGPQFSLVADYAKAGRLEVWDPWVNGGALDFAEPQLGTASPVLLIFARLSPNPFGGFIAYWLAVWMFGGFGMVRLCRHLGAPAWGAAVIAAGFIACGVYTGNAEHTSVICSFSFLPWIVWQFDTSLHERKRWRMVQAGLLWGLSAAGGYPGVTITAAIFVALWGIGRIWIGGDEPEPGGQPSAGRRAIWLGLALAIFGSVGFAVMSPAYVSFLKEGRGYSYRADELDRSYALSSNALPPAAYATVASPSLYQLRSPDHRLIWPESDISMTNVYMGVLVTVLALSALSRPSRWRIWLALVAVFFGCCAVGSHLPVRGWLYELMPPTRYFRHPSLFRLFLIFAASVLAAYAARDLETSWTRQSRARSGGMPCLIAAMAAAAALAVYAATMRSVGQAVGADTPALIQLLLTWPAAAAVFFVGWRGLVARKIWVACLVILAAGDAASTLSLDAQTIYDAGGLPSWRAMKAGHVSSIGLLPGGWARSIFPPEVVDATRNNRNVALKAATLDNRVPLKNAFFTQYLDDPALNQIAVGDKRVWFSDRPIWLAPTPDAFSAFVEAIHARDGPLLVLHSVEDMNGQVHPPAPAAVERASLQAAPALAPARVDLVAYEPDALAFRYHADRDGWLLVTDRWASAWTATVNGRDQPVLGGNFVFRAVAVARGDNLVEFRYQPRGYFGWVALSWSTVALAAVWPLWRRWKQRVRAPAALSARL